MDTIGQVNTVSVVGVNKALLVDYRNQNQNQEQLHYFLFWNSSNIYTDYLARGGVRISQDPALETKVSHDQGHIYIYHTVDTSFTYIHIGIHNQLTNTTYILVLHYTHNMLLPLYVLLSSNLDIVKQARTFATVT